jgi:hypothetical protein
MHPSAAIKLKSLANSTHFPIDQSSNVYADGFTLPQVRRTSVL